MGTDVLAKNVVATGAMGTPGRVRVKGISFLPVATPGSISLKNGGAGGTELFKLDIGSGSTTSIDIPGEGILFQSDPYVTLTTVTSVTIIYG